MASLRIGAFKPLGARLRLTPVLLLIACEAPLVPGGDRPLPLIGRIEPAIVEVGAIDVRLVVHGTDLSPWSVIRIDGADLPTTHVGPRQLEADFPAVAAATIGSHHITVMTPPPGGGESARLYIGVETLAARGLPRIRRFEPIASEAGTAPFTLTVHGDRFSSQSTLLWDGAEKSTTFLDNRRLSVQVEAVDMADVGARVVRVRNGAAGPTSFPRGFPVVSAEPPTLHVVTVPLVVADLARDPIRDVVYASVPESAADSANSVLALDPNTGEVLWSGHVDGDPAWLEVSDDGSYLYVALAGAPRVARFTLSTGSRDVDIELGDSTWQDIRARDIAPIAGRPRSIAVEFGTHRHLGIAVYDGAERRLGFAAARDVGTNHIEPSSWSSRLYGYHNESTGYAFRRIALRADGVVVDGATQSGPRGFSDDIVYDSGLMFTFQGEVFDPEEMSVIATMTPGGVIRPDVLNGRVHWFANQTITTVLYTASRQLGAVVVPDAAGATNMIRFASDGLALGGGANVVFVRSDLVGS